MSRWSPFILVLAASSISLGSASSATAPTAFETQCAQFSHSSKRGNLHEKLFHLFRSHLETPGMEISPEEATFDGYPGENDRWTDLRLDGIQQRRRELEAPLRALHSIDRAKLSTADRLNYDLFEYDLQDQIRLSRFPSEYLPLNQLQGVVTDVGRTLANAPRKTEKDYADLLSRLGAIPALIAQTTDLLRQGLKQGITPPRITLRDVPDQVDALVEKDPERIHS